MRAFGLLLVAAALAACSSPPVTANVPATVHHGTSGSADRRDGLDRLASEGNCIKLSGEPGPAPPMVWREGPRRSGTGEPQPQPSGPAGTPTPAPAGPGPTRTLAEPTAVLACTTLSSRSAT